MDVLARDGGDGIKYGLCAIDNFTKMVSVIPIKHRSPTEVIRGLKLILKRIGKPKQSYSDEEPSLISQEFFRFINENKRQLFRHQHMHILLSDL